MPLALHILLRVALILSVFWMSAAFFPAHAAESGVSLRDSVRKALAYNPTLKAAQEQRQAAEQDIRKAQAGFLPKIQGSAGAGVVRSDTPTSRAYKEQNTAYGTGNLSLTLTQPLWDGWNTRGQVAAKTARFESVDFGMEDSATTLVFDTVVAHITVLQQRALVRLAQANIKAHEDILALQQDNFKQGFSSMGEVRQIEGRLSRAKATFMDYRYSQEKAEITYLRLTGAKVPQTLAEAALPARTYKTLNEARGASKYTNPRIEAALASIRAARGEEDVARSGFYPRVDLEVGPNVSDQGGKRKGQQQSNLGGMVVMRWVFYSGGADAANVKMTAAQTRKTRQELHALLDSLDADIRDTWQQILTAEKLHAEYTRAMKASREARDAYRYQFSMGTRSLLDVLDTENDYFSSACQQVIAQGNRLAGSYRLLGLSGELLAEMGVDTKSLRSGAPTINPSVPDRAIMSISNLEDTDL